MAISTAPKIRWKIPGHRVTAVNETAALVTLEWPDELDDKDLLEGGHVALSYASDAETHTSYFAVLSVDRALRTITLYVKRSTRGLVSAALLDPAGGAMLSMSRPAPGILLPGAVRRPLFVAAGSGLASGLGLLGRLLRDSDRHYENSALFFVGRSDECETVRSIIAAGGLETSMELRLWDTGRRGGRVTGGDLQSVVDALRPDWIYVCGPASFAGLVRESAAAAAGPAVPVVAECYEPPLEAARQK